MAIGPGTIGPWTVSINAFSLAVIVNCTDVCPPATLTEAGANSDADSLERETFTPPGEAGAVSATVQVSVIPAKTRPSRHDNWLRFGITPTTTIACWAIDPSVADMATV